MASLAIHKEAAKARLHPREWLLQALRAHGSRHKLAAALVLTPNAISRALRQFQIIGITYNFRKGGRHAVVCEWLREEDLLRRRHWQQSRRNSLAGDASNR